MFRFFMTAVLAVSMVSVSLADTPEELVKKMDDDDFFVREKATGDLCKLCNEDYKVVEYAKERLDKGVSLEVKWRLKGVVAHYYRVADVMAPIWSLSKEHRYEGKKDVAKEWYEKARDLYLKEQEKKEKNKDMYTNYYNNGNIMKIGTEMYLRHLLDKGVKRTEVEKIAKNMRTSWEKEDELTRKYISNSCFYGNITHEEPPSPVEERLKIIKEKLDTNEDDGHWDLSWPHVIVPASEYFYNG